MVAPGQVQIPEAGVTRGADDTAQIAMGAEVEGDAMQALRGVTDLRDKPALTPMGIALQD